MLDVGLYRFDQQVACQRYRQTNLDAESKLRGFSEAFVASLRDAFMPKATASVLA